LYWHASVPLPDPARMFPVQYPDDDSASKVEFVNDVRW
jgi:hypothetical protein